jgi:hypothetical protein
VKISSEEITIVTQPPELGDPKKKDLLVFQILRESECSECKEKLWKGCFITMNSGKPLCMKCADLDHLFFLQSGDAALSRRAKKHSKLWAVVVRFSRARKRYERQGLLVEEQALTQAEEECLADTEVRELRRLRDEERRAEEDEALTAAMEAKLRELFPGCPAEEAKGIARHTSVRSSGRVGRSAAGRALEEEVLTLAAVAYVRHRHTDYDELLMDGWERGEARQSVRRRIEDVLDRWSRK